MTDQNTPETTAGSKRKGGSLQTKALAGLVAVMLAAAIVALVFVTSGSDKSNQQAGAAQPTSSDVGRATTPAEPATSSGAAASSTTASSTAASSTAASSTAAPSTTAASSSAASSTAAATPTKTKAPPSRTTHSSNAKKVVYTVKKGDTLTDIGAWYKLHGYLKLYDWNKSVIGKNPDLIFPGQRIIVSDGKVGVAQK